MGAETRGDDNIEKRRTNMLSWGFATEEVCVRGGPHVAKADNEKGRATEGS